MSWRARSNSAELRSVFGVMGRQVEAGRAGGSVLVVGFVGFGLRPEQAVGNHEAHAGPEAAVEAAVKISQRLGGRGGEVGAAGDQGGQGGGQGIASAGKGGVEALELLAGQ